MLKKLSLYTIIATVSVFLRQTYIPTPAEAMDFNVISIFDLSALLNDFSLLPTVATGIIGTFINYMFETPLYLITFAIVGLIYQRGDGGWKGSFLYLLIYSLNIAVITIGFMIGWIPWALILILILYIALLIIISVAYESLLKFI